MKALFHFASLIIATMALTQAKPVLGSTLSAAPSAKERPDNIDQGRLAPDTLGFEENKGQVTTMNGDRASFVRFRYSEGNTNIFLLGNGVAYQFDRTHLPDGYDQLLQEARQNPAKHEQLDELRSKVRTETYRMDMVLEGADTKARITTDDRSSSFANYYGQDAMNVHRFGQVTYHDVYPGIDWKVYTTANGIEYDFIVHPGADPGRIRLRFKDQEELALEKSGRLVHGNRMGRFIEEAPVSFQADREVRTRFVLEEDLLHFELGAYDRSQPLTIDPARIWATYYGSTGDDAAYSTMVDGSGNVYLAGQTKSTGSIASGGHQNTLGGNYDAYLVKLDASGARLWATYYGGALEDGGTSCAVDGSSNVYLAGYAKSTSAIAASGHQGTIGGGQDAFLVKFNSSGVRQWATYYGGTVYDYGASCATDGSGNVYLAGSSNSNAAISSGGHQNTYNGNYDAFLVKFNSSGVRQWGTYYGGSNGENGNACAVDGSGNVYLAGQTNSTGSIASSGHQGTFAGGTGDGFLVKFNAAGVRQWGTYYGGTGNELGHGCAVDGSGNVYLAGETTSTTTIAAGGYQNTRKGLIDAFLVKFNSTGTRQWGTYYGGTANDMGWSCVSDASANIYLVGQTSSTSGIAKGGHQNIIGGGGDAFVVKFNANGGRIWGSYYGGTLDDSGRSGSADANGYIHIAGYTNSTAAIAAGGFQNTFGGGTYDGFLAKFSGLSGCPGGNQVVVAINTDSNPDQITWELSDENNVVIATGGPASGEVSQLVTDTVCLGSTPTSTCFGFRLMDSFGDGLSGIGNWQLKSTGGRVLLGDEFPDENNSPSLSPANPSYTAHSFCLPVGNTHIADKSCGIFNFSPNSNVYCTNAPGATS
ncbi:MAG: SBBP repeat-containing protein, partial [Flavobacteriales bacterium]